MRKQARFSLLACLRKRDKDTERSSFLGSDSSFVDNGSTLLEDLIASCDGKCNPIRSYSADELKRATNDFDPSRIMIEDGFYNMFQGLLDNRSVIIKDFIVSDVTPFAVKETRFMAIRDIVISIQMSNHRNALKLLGCCLEVPIPVLVYEFAGTGVLNNNGGYGDDESLSWKDRLRIAKQLANAITYLHTAFPRPIIHRNFKPGCIFLDDDYVPKISDFSLSITIPPEQFHVEDLVKGTVGYIDPEYMDSGYISEKTDVYSFGVTLLIFLTGRKAHDKNEAEEVISIVSYVKLQTCDGQVMTVVDPKLLEELNGDDKQAQQQQLQDFVALALSCVQRKSEVRPEMINVAKELVRIEKLTSQL